MASMIGASTIVHVLTGFVIGYYSVEDFTSVAHLALPFGRSMVIAFGVGVPYVLLAVSLIRSARFWVLRVFSSSIVCVSVATIIVAQAGEIRDRIGATSFDIVVGGCLCSLIAAFVCEGLVIVCSIVSTED